MHQQFDVDQVIEQLYTRLNTLYVEENNSSQIALFHYRLFYSLFLKLEAITFIRDFFAIRNLCHKLCRKNM